VDALGAQYNNYQTSERPHPWMSRRFLPLLSYAQHEVDPGLDASRNEGEARLRRIRALLRITTKTPGMESFLDPSNKASLPAMLGPRLKDPPCQWELAERQGVLDSLLSSNHKEAPTATRVAPTVRTCTVCTVGRLPGCLAALAAHPPVRR